MGEKGRDKYKKRLCENRDKENYSLYVKNRVFEVSFLDIETWELL
jgi:hypothetical protein